jgi:hypothetical protein
MISSRTEEHFILTRAELMHVAGLLSKLMIVSRQTLGANRPSYQKRLALLRGALAENYAPIQALIPRFASAQQLQTIYDQCK